MSIDDFSQKNKLWQQWEKTNSQAVENQLIEHYQYLVYYHVERVASNIPANFDKNDLFSLGLMGLFDALHKFELERNLKFDTYATIRIHGSIMDGLRKEDWLPRSLREKSKQIERTESMLYQQLGYQPSPEEIAKELDWTVKEVETIIADNLYANLLSTDVPITQADDQQPSHLGALLKDEETPTPIEEMLEIEWKEELIEALKQLSEREQLVVNLHYMEELTLTEIGQVMEVSTSRISQIHKRTMIKLKDILLPLKKVYVESRS